MCVCLEYMLPYFTTKYSLQKTSCPEAVYTHITREMTVNTEYSTYILHKSHGLNQHLKSDLVTNKHN